MAKKIVWCGNGYDGNDDYNRYKYVACVRESNSSYADMYAANNLRDLKSFVYNQVRQLYDTASGNIYYSSDEWLSDPIYMCWRDGGSTTHCQNLI